ncbi:hypothetical protein SCLCIDRAFT_1221511 [Scleroderma citrinum Foug A]|uniref:Uncharacterized protein n=1 Tax=Scleroderma citrinum Foug A TaxID=1036808 RepID=A0A0C3DFN1_9AGAM|nr:hypothetical protein SCLCIDRAFT_1221511 [Scleroderma citrinum Foug A]
MSPSSTQSPVEAADTYPERTPEEREEAFPPQRHAGAVGIGPEYVSKTGFMEKVVGLKEEIKGKILRKPELVQHGHDRRTGRLAKKAREQADAQDPPNTAGT